MAVDDVDHLRELMDERDRRYQERFDASTRAVDAAFASAKEAVAKAELSAERRFESVNEFRAQLGDQASTFLTRREYEAKHEALEAQVNSLIKVIERSKGRGAGIGAMYGWIIGAVGAIVGIMTVVIIATR